MGWTLGWTEAEVTEAGESLHLLALETDDDVTLYPAFQLDEAGAMAGLHEVLAVLQAGTAGQWTCEQWLDTALADEDPPHSIDTLRAGRLDEVLRKAEYDTGAWCS